MARTINCDAPGCQQPAAYLLTLLDSGSTAGFCTPHYFDACAELILAAQARLEAGEPATVDAPAADAPPPPDQVVEGDTWTCAACGALFPSLEAIEEHVAEAHPAPAEAAQEVAQPAQGVAADHQGGGDQEAPKRPAREQRRVATEA